MSQRLKPFFLASKASGSLTDAVTATKSALTGAGFELVGEYSPNAETVVVCFTSNEQRALAAQSERGGFGAVLRASCTSVDNQVQIAYTNPTYMAVAYRFANDNAATTQRLIAALNKAEEFGSVKGVKEDELRKYHYAVGMEYFNEPVTLMKYSSHAEAVAACEAGFAQQRGGVSKIYRVDIAGKNEVVFGCGLKASDKYADDNYIMKMIDFLPVKHSAHLPYECMVSEHKVIMLHARFRIAVNFPDLDMTGDHGFTKIMETPSAIKKAISIMAGNASP